MIAGAITCRLCFQSAPSTHLTTTQNLTLQIFHVHPTLQNCTISVECGMNTEESNSPPSQRMMTPPSPSPAVLVISRVIYNYHSNKIREIPGFTFVNNKHCQQHYHQRQHQEFSMSFLYIAIQQWCNMKHEVSPHLNEATTDTVNPQKSHPYINVITKTVSEGQSLNTTEVRPKRHL